MQVLCQYKQMMCLLTVGPATMIMQTGKVCMKGNELKGQAYQTGVTFTTGTTHSEGVVTCKCKVRAAGILMRTGGPLCHQVIKL